MDLLFDDALWPITSTIGSVKAPCARAADSYVRWQGPLKLGWGRAVSARQVTGNLQTLLRHLDPLRRTEPSRVLFLRTSGEWTAFFDNLVSGTDTFPVLPHLTEDLHCVGVRASIVPDVGREGDAGENRYGGTVLEIMDPDRGKPPLRYRRTIAAVNDGGRWTFDLSGEPEPFEELSHYTGRHLRDRFTPELLDRYLRALGIRAFDPDFYLRDGVLVVERYPDDTPDQYISVEQLHRARHIRR